MAPDEEGDGTSDGRVPRVIVVTPDGRPRDFLPAILAAAAKSEGGPIILDVRDRFRADRVMPDDDLDFPPPRTIPIYKVRSRSETLFPRERDTGPSLPNREARKAAAAASRRKK